MSSKSISNIVRIAIIAIALCGLAICIYWFPFSFLISVNIMYANSATALLVAYWSMLSFFWACAAPCFFILFHLWKITTAIKREKLFTKEVANRVKLCAKILFIDLGVFLIGNVVFTILRINLYVVLYFMLIIVGFVIACLAAILSHYIFKAAQLQEENENTI